MDQVSAIKKKFLLLLVNQEGDIAVIPSKTIVQMRRESSPEHPTDKTKPVQQPLSIDLVVSIRVSCFLQGKLP